MAKVASEFELAYRRGQQDRKAGRTITTKVTFLAQNPWGYPHDLMLDLWLCYSKGYRATAPNPSVLESMLNAK